jgi:SAM-dependent methyltransferase
MPKPSDVYVKCDDLDNIPAIMRDNYLFESNLLHEKLAKNSTVLQVGSMDGERAIRLLKERPDLHITGLEVEKSLVELADQKVSAAHLRMQSICGDITNPPSLSLFDYVMCTNNTLGYIPDQQAALESMRSLSKEVFVSVFGEKFTNKLAEEYFHSLGLSIGDIKYNTFTLKDFTQVKRYSRDDVEIWSKDVIDSPVGYFCLVN